MDKRINSLHNQYIQFEIFFRDIELIIKYLNREINVEKMPDHIRNREDAYNEIKSWNYKVEEAMNLQNELLKEGMDSNISFPFERFLVQFE